MRNALETIVTELRLTDRQLDQHLRRTRKQLYADVLVEMARRSLTVPADGLKPRIVVTVVTGDESFTRLCELASGHVIAPASLVPYLDIVDVNAILFDGPTRAIKPRTNVASPESCGG